MIRKLASLSLRNDTYLGNNGNNGVIQNLLLRYFQRKTAESSINSTLFYIKIIVFLWKIYKLICFKQKYSVAKLDKILKNLKTNGIGYFKREVYANINLEGMDSVQTAEYILSFLKIMKEENR